MQFTVFTANCVGKPGNCSYPNRLTITGSDSLRRAVAFDHVCAEYQENYRSADKYLTSDVIVMDVDNDHSEDPAEWITNEKMLELFEDAAFMTAPSRHHMLPKEGKSARPRFHVYFPIEVCDSAEKYAAMKRSLQAKYPFFDDNALDAARFIFGANVEEIFTNDNNWLGQFLDECCEKDPSYVEKSGELYQAYRSYCLQNGEFTRSTTDFYAALDKAGFNRYRKSTGVKVYGLKLKEGQDFLE